MLYPDELQAQISIYLTVIASIRGNDEHSEKFAPVLFSTKKVQARHIYGLVFISKLKKNVKGGVYVGLKNPSK